LKCASRRALPAVPLQQQFLTILHFNNFFFTQVRVFKTKSETKFFDGKKETGKRNGQEFLPLTLQFGVLLFEKAVTLRANL
jgi:hypothetical protein